MSYILIKQPSGFDTAYLTDSGSQTLIARRALRAAGLESAPVYAGVPDGAGDSYANGYILNAALFTTEQVDAARAVKWGRLEDACLSTLPANDLDQERWEVLSKTWEEAVGLALDAGTEGVAVAHLRTALKIEGEWGTGELTGQVCEALGLKLGKGA